MTVKNVHPAFESWYDKAKKARIVASGPDEVKQAGRLFVPAPTGHTPHRYKSYIQRGSFFNALQRTITAFRGMILRREADYEVPDAMIEIMKNATLDGRSIHDVIRYVVNAALNPSRSGMLVEFDAIANRPKIALYTGESIMDWATGNVGGRTVTTMVKLVEQNRVPHPEDPFTYVSATRYRVLSLENGVYTQRVYTNPNARWDEYVEIIVPVRRGQPLDFIPFLAINAADTEMDPSDPLLYDLIEENIGHFRNSCDLEQSLHYQGVKQPWIAGATGTANAKPLIMGQEAVWMLPPNVTPGVLEFSDNGIDSLKQAMADKERRMAVLGARVIENSGGNPTQVETATGHNIRNSAETATLTDVVQNVEAAMNKVVKWMAYWMYENADDVEISMNKDFVATKLSPNELQTLVASWQNGAISSEDYYWNLVQGEVIMSGAKPEVEIARLDAARAAAAPAPAPVQITPPATE